MSSQIHEKLNFPEKQGEGLVVGDERDSVFSLAEGIVTENGCVAARCF